jgi:hypothetical protein
MRHSLAAGRDNYMTCWRQHEGAMCQIVSKMSELQRALYHLIKAKAGPETVDRLVTCLSGGAATSYLISEQQKSAAEAAH